MGIIKADNVRADFTAAYEVIGEPEWEISDERPARNPEDEPYRFVHYVLPIRELYPTPATTDRKIRVQLSRAQARAVIDVEMNDGDSEVKMHPSSSMGRFVKSMREAGVKADVDDDAIQGSVLVMTNESVTQPNSTWRETVWTARAYLGTRDNYDADRMKQLVDEFNEGVKGGSTATDY